MTEHLFTSLDFSCALDLSFTPFIYVSVSAPFLEKPWQFDVAHNTVFSTRLIDGKCVLPIGRIRAHEGGRNAGGDYEVLGA